jgi:hypothetical protein
MASINGLPAFGLSWRPEHYLAPKGLYWSHELGVLLGGQIVCKQNEIFILQVILDVLLERAVNPLVAKI